MIDTIRKWAKRDKSRVAVRDEIRPEITSSLDECNEYTTGYPPTDDPKFLVDVFVLIDEKVTRRDGQLLDLSPNGAKLFVTSRTEIGEAIGLRLRIPDLGIDLATAATICWTGLKGQGGWVVGCSLAEDVPESVFHSIADSGYLERRDGERRKIRAYARARGVDRESQPVEIRLDDYSAGGFCMFSNNRFDPGTNLLLELDLKDESTVLIPGEVRWANGCRLGHSMGCRFLSLNGFEILHNALAQRHNNQLPELGQP